MTTPDTEISLTRGSLRLIVSPYGASLRGLSQMGADIVTGYTGAAHKVGGQGDVLIPFPGRVSHGRYAFDGQTYQMEKNDHEADAAIHGFLRRILWDTAAQDEYSATFATRFDAQAHAGYPFALSAQVTYTVTKNGMACAFVITNIGNGPAPVAAGFHPYFAVGGGLIDTDILRVPFAATLEYKDLLPTGRVLAVEGTSNDFRTPRPIANTVFNTCYAQPQRDADGWTRLSLSAPMTGRSITVELDGAMGYVVLYSGDPLPESHRRRSLAIEPQTCGSDALNHPDWGLATLGQGEALAGEWRVVAG